jgi:hypothetical protein
MKPLGIYFAISDTNGERTGLDDDYDWHVRQAASASGPAVSKNLTPRAFLTERLRGLGRGLPFRSEEPTARRLSPRA